MTQPAPATTSRGKRSRFRMVLLSLALLVGLWLLASYAVAYRLTRRARPQHPEPAPAVEWGTLQPLRLISADGQQLGAWFADGKPGAPAVVLLHANHSTRSDCLAPAARATSLGCPVLLVSLRAHGDSTGEVNDFGYGARHDVVAAVEWLEKHRPGGPVLLWGRSLGSAAAVFAAGELGDRARGCILESPYQDLYTAVRNRTAIHLPAPVDAVAYAGLRTVAPLVLPHADKISPMEAAAGVHPGTAVLILAGAKDRHARPGEAHAIAGRLRGRVEVLVFEGAGHLGMEAADPGRYAGVVRAFVEKCRR